MGVLGFDNKNVWWILDSGRLNNLDVSADGFNTLKWIVKDKVAYFFVNQDYIASFKILDKKTPGILTIGTNFYYYESAKIDDKITKFRNFSVKSLDDSSLSDRSFYKPFLLSAESWITLGNNLSNHDLNYEGIKACKNAQIRDPNNSNAFYCEGLLRYKRQEYQEAIILYERAIKINKQENWENLTDALIRKGWALYSLESHKKALQSFEEAIKIDKKNAWAIRGKGFALFYLKSYQQSLLAFSKAIKLDTQDSWSWAGKGDVFSLRKI